ncbi:MAG: hypothetical protein GY772_29580 [bacterium]|nr:hypothetical protein [bacterium]
MGKTKQPTILQVEKLKDLMDAGGCINDGEWSPLLDGPDRAVPVCAERMSIHRACRQPGFAGRAARKVRKANPYAVEVIVVTRIRAARRLLRELPERKAAAYSRWYIGFPGKRPKTLGAILGIDALLKTVGGVLKAENPPRPE